MIYKKILSTIIIFLAFNILYANEKVIAKIPEASGITYSLKSDSLFVVNDEGIIYEISKKGKILRDKKIGDYDFEGITIDDKNSLLLVAIEGIDNILVLDKNSFNIIKEISIKREYKGIEVLKKGGDGIEAISLFEDKIYLSNQSKKFYPKEDSSLIVIVDYDLKKDKLKIKNIIDHGYADISGMTFLDGALYLISDKNNLIIEYDVKNKKVINEIKLSKKYAQEGITFDNKKNLYIADDNGKILKIKKWKN